MLLNELRQLVRRFLVEDQERPDRLPSTKLAEDDLDSFLVPYNDTTTVQGVATWVPFQLAKKFTSHSRLSKLAAMVGVTPADAAQTFKKGKPGSWETPVRRPEYRGADKRLPKYFEPVDVFNHVVVMDDKLRDRVLQKMADAIVMRFKREKFDEVMAIDSSYSMSMELAEKVAAGLGLPVTTLRKEMDPKKVDWDFKAFEKWVSSGQAHDSWVKARETSPKKTPETFEGYILNTLEHLDGQDYNYIVNTLLPRGEKPSALRHIKLRQKFWNFFEKLKKLHEPKKVLVVDDNVASGLTNVHAQDRLVDAGYVPTFVAGYKR